MDASADQSGCEQYEQQLADADAAGGQLLCRLPQWNCHRQPARVRKLYHQALDCTPCLACMVDSFMTLHSFLLFHPPVFCVSACLPASVPVANARSSLQAAQTLLSDMSLMPPSPLTLSAAQIAYLNEPLLAIDADLLYIGTPHEINSVS